MARKAGPTDDFSDTGKVPSSGPHLDPTRAGAAKFGLEELEESGDIAFHEIVTELFNIGRDNNCNLMIRGDTKTSRRHATIQRKGLKYHISDNGSSNGTMVNGKKVEGSIELQPGDKVLIGSHWFTFVKRA
jgi:predicted component of type VI protein secretion system